MRRFERNHGLCLTIAFVVCAVCGAAGATDKCGAICDETWDVAGSPYVITCDVSVANNCRLDIEADVSVRLQSGSKLSIAGELSVSGTPGSPVEFTSDSAPPGPGDWSSIELQPGSTAAIAWADIRYATRGVDATTAELTMRNGTVRDSSETGVHVSGGVLGMTGTTLADNADHGVFVGGAAGFTLNDVGPSGSTYGVYVDGAASGTATGLDAQDNFAGLHVKSDSSGATTCVISDSTLTHNEIGVWVQGVNDPAWFNPDVTVNGSSLHDNARFNYLAGGLNQARPNVLQAAGNWWGSADASTIARTVPSPHVDWCRYLVAPPPAATQETFHCPELAVCDGDLAWNETDRPYLLVADAFVCPAATLEIGPGVTLRARTGNYAGDGGSGIVAEGTVDVSGTADAPVTLTDTGWGYGAKWGGFQLLPGASASIAHAAILGAGYGVRGQAATVLVTDSEFHRFGRSSVEVVGGSLEMARIKTSVADVVNWGVRILGGAEFALDDVQTTNTFTGIDVGGGATGTLHDISARSHNDGLVVWASGAGRTSVTVTSSRFAQNSRGIYVGGWSGSEGYIDPELVVTASSFQGNGTALRATGFMEPEIARVWAPDNWWGSDDPAQIADAIYDHDDDPASPRVITQAFGTICDLAIGRDADRDGLGDSNDNCPLIPNAGQADMDSDGMGDACDPNPASAPAGPCDGIVDTIDGFADNDHDGWGDPCDFHPLRSDSYPGAAELCDGRDNDGDGTFADGELIDEDGDGGVACVDGSGDCDDSDPGVSACACERCANGNDDDCDGATDGADAGCVLNEYCVVVLPGSDPLRINVEKGACGAAANAGLYDVIRGFTTLLGDAGSGVDLGDVSCTSANLAWDRVTDLSKDPDPGCGPRSVYWLARESGDLDFGANSAGEPRDVMHPDPPCP